MARPKKKNPNPKMSMEQLLNRAVELFAEPYDDRDERDASLPSLRSVADELNTTILRTRKLLITADYYSSYQSRTVQDMMAAGASVTEIMEATGLKKSLLELEYSELKEKPYLLPICQLKRWMRLINPKKRKQIKKEIKRVRAMKTETIESFEKLLISLGL